MGSISEGDRGKSAPRNGAITQTRFLRAIPRADAERLLRDAQFLDLPLGFQLHQRAERPRHTYLLTAGMVSTVYISEQGNSVELSMLGDEGPVGWLLLLGNLLPVAEATMQVAGAGYRVPFAILQHEFNTCPPVRQRVLELAQQKALSAYQIAACNRLHRAGQRFARWLLTAADRSGNETLHVTQEFLATMLGTRRTTVAEEAGALQRAGAIQYSRGHLRILDRPLLEKYACECYQIVRRQYEQLFETPLA